MHTLTARFSPFRLLVILAVALFWFTSSAARAEDAPITETKPVQHQQQQQQPGNPGNQGDSEDRGKTHARRKEDDEEGGEISADSGNANEDRQGFFSSLFGGKARKQSAAAEETNKALAAENAALKEENKELKAAAAQFDREWPAIETAITAGQSDAPALQSPFGQKIATLVASGVTASLARSGHDPKKLPGPGADAPDTGKNSTPPVSGPSAAAAGSFASHWAAKGWTPPGLN